MASISQRPNGDQIIRFYENGERKTISVCSKSRDKAETLKRHVESILSTRELGDRLDPLTAAWLAKAPDSLRERLAAVGLITIQRVETPAGLALGEFLHAYIDRRNDVKPTTRTNWLQSKRNLISHFGKDKLITDINQADAKDFERYLRTMTRDAKAKKATAQKVIDAENAGIDVKENANAENEKVTNEKTQRKSLLSSATIRKRISNTKLFFNDAVERKLISENPFAKLKSAAMGNADRQFFVTQDMIAKILKACPDDEWRLLIALARYGGLRTPSESLSLKWTDIDWANERMTVYSPKTEHYEGKDSRIVPLYPELRPYLDAAHFAARDGAFYVIDRWRAIADAAKDWKALNLRTHFERIIKRASVKPWPKLWQNLRSSRQTELEERFPSHVVCAWMGNSERVARRHYLQIHDAHFARATAKDDSESRSHFVPHEEGQIESDEVAGKTDLQERANKGLCESAKVAADSRKRAREDSNLRPAV